MRRWLLSYASRSYAVLDTRSGRVVHLFRFPGQAYRCAHNSNGAGPHRYEVHRLR